MIPYNTCENRWLNSAKKKIRSHWREFEPVYGVMLGIMGIALFVLAVVTAVSSFLP